MSIPRFHALLAILLLLVSCHSGSGNTPLKAIDSALTGSASFISGQSDRVYHSLLQKQADPTTRLVSERWSPVAFKARMIAARTILFIDSVHRKMTAAGLLSSEERISLFDTLIAVRRDFLNVFPDSLDPKGYFLAKDRESFERHLPLLRGYCDVGDPVSSFRLWSAVLFQGDTATTALALDKLKIDVRFSEYEIATYCDMSAVSTVDRYDRFEPLISLSTSIAAPGDTIELEAGIGAYSESAGPKITIDGAWMPLNPNGVAVYCYGPRKNPDGIRSLLPLLLRYLMASGIP